MFDSGVTVNFATGFVVGSGLSGSGGRSSKEGDDCYCAFMGVVIGFSLLTALNTMPGTAMLYAYTDYFDELEGGTESLLVEEDSVMWEVYESALAIGVLTVLAGAFIAASGQACRGRTRDITSLLGGLFMAGGGLFPASAAGFFNPGFTPFAGFLANVVSIASVTLSVGSISLAYNLCAAGAEYRARRFIDTSRNTSSGKFKLPPGVFLSDRPTDSAGISIATTDTQVSGNSSGHDMELTEVVVGESIDEARVAPQSP